MIDKSVMRLHHSEVRPTENDFVTSNFIELKYESRVIGRIQIIKIETSPSAIKVISLSIQIWIAENIDSPAFILKSLIKSFLGRLPLIIDDSDVHIILENISQINFDQSEFKNILTQFQFQHLESGRFLTTVEASHLSPLAQVKKQLLQARNSSQVIGRGFVTDASQLNPAGLRLLIDEYNDLAWGRTSWAKNSQLADDELSLIQNSPFSFGHAVEIGAGSGRITSTLAKYCTHLTATDYLSDILHILEVKIQLDGLKNVECVRDDILNTNLIPESFDTVFFLENGLGAMLNPQHRQRAVFNMTRLLKPGGRLVLGLRTLGDESYDQVMPASQDPNTFFGIYHTFSQAEATRFANHELKLETIFQGDSRPAGGHSLFCIFKKEAR